MNKNITILLISLFLLAIATPGRATTAANSQGCLLSSGTWLNHPLSRIESPIFRVTFDATPLASNIEAVTGLSSGLASGYSNLAVIVRFNSNGTIDARSGSAYTATAVIPYSARVTYHFTLYVNIATHTYNAYVRIGSVLMTIGRNLGFQSEQAQAPMLGYLAAMTQPGTHTVCNITASNGTIPPTITSQPVSRTIPIGNSASFSITSTGTAPLRYQWRKNGITLGGANLPSYITPAATAADNAAQFTVVVSNVSGSVTSNPALLNVSAAPTLLLNSSSSQLDFGNVDVTHSGSQNVILTNAGNSNVTISRVLVEGAGFNSTAVNGVILYPGKSATIASTFAPSSSGAATGKITVTSDASNSPALISLSGIGVVAPSHSVSLSWLAGSVGVTGYHAYYSTVSGGPYIKMTSSLLTVPSYKDINVQSGQTYYYVVTTLTSDNLESAYSSEVTAYVP